MVASLVAILVKRVACRKGVSPPGQPGGESSSQGFHREERG